LGADRKEYNQQHYSERKQRFRLALKATQVVMILVVKLEGAVKQVIIEELRPGGVLANRR